MCGLQKSDRTVFINPGRIKFAPLLERKPAKISCERKTMKWATKLAIKRKAKGKRRERVKNRNKFGKKKFKFWLMRRKTEKLVITSKQKIMSLVLEFLFSHTDTNWPKKSSKRRIWAKMPFICW